MKKSALTVAELRATLHYDPDSGIFTWKKQRGSRALAGHAAGFDNVGYIGIRIVKRRYLAHRLAWLYMTGRWPAADIDHINGIRSDNRFANLREATRTQNNANTPLGSNSKSGFKGVSFERSTGRWRAQIRKHGKSISLGRFDAPEAAHAAYVSAAKETHGQFARTN